MIKRFSQLFLVALITITFNSTDALGDLINGPSYEISTDFPWSDESTSPSREVASLNNDHEKEEDAKSFADVLERSAPEPSPHDGNICSLESIEGLKEVLETVPPTQTNTPPPQKKTLPTNWAWHDCQPYDCVSYGSCLIKAGCCQWTYCIDDVKTQRLPLCTSDEGSCKDSCFHCLSSSGCATLECSCSLCDCLVKDFFCIRDDKKSTCETWGDCTNQRGASVCGPWTCLSMCIDFIRCSSLKDQFEWLFR